MSALGRLYLVACWSYILSFHLTFTLLTLGGAERAALRQLEFQEFATLE